MKEAENIIQRLFDRFRVQGVLNLVANALDKHCDRAFLYSGIRLDRHRKTVAQLRSIARNYDS